MQTQPSYYPFRSEDSKQAYLEAYDALIALAPVTYSSQTVETRFGTTHINICGPATAPPLILLHGGQATSGLWARNVGAFCQDYCVYAIDTIGDFGKSVMVEKIKDIEGYLEWILEVMEALCVEQASFVAMSYGGWITSNLALRCPGVVKKAALISPAATFQKLSWAFLWRAIRMLLPVRRYTETLYTWSAIPAFMEDPDYRATMEALIEQAWRGRRHFRSQGFIPPSIMTDEQLQSIEVPLLLLLGDQEKIYDANKAIERAERLVPHIETELISPASHDLIVGQAEAVNRRILQFLSEE
ncbi:MAG: alpha/beta hydrolase [Deltaproteobacteria bacterium]|nr:MAG: alpha/beta hydrolase [Deltaproteobacteria bacterium]